MEFNKKNLFFAFSVIILVLAILIFAFSLKNLNKIFTGYASDTAQTYLDVESQASIEFTVNSTGWGKGAVNETNQSAVLDTDGTVDGGNWSENTQALFLENKGNSNVSLELRANNSASNFIGGSLITPLYQIKLVSNATEPNACNSTNNFSSFQQINTSDSLACSIFQYINANDSLELDIKVRIPQDALPGNKTSLITATGTVI